MDRNRARRDYRIRWDKGIARQRHLLFCCDGTPMYEPGPHNPGVEGDKREQA